MGYHMGKGGICIFKKRWIPLKKIVAQPAVEACHHTNQKKKRDGRLVCVVGKRGRGEVSFCNKIKGPMKKYTTPWKS